MQPISVLSIMAAMGLSFGLIGLATPVHAEPSAEEINAQPSIEQPGVDAENVDLSDFVLLEPRGTELSTEDPEALNNLADRINQTLGGSERSDNFIPDGMVVRGSNSSLQLGGEL